jgi:hypothetical protein
MRKFRFLKSNWYSDIAYLRQDLVLGPSRTVLPSRGTTDIGVIFHLRVCSVFAEPLANVDGGVAGIRGTNDCFGGEV